MLAVVGLVKVTVPGPEVVVHCFVVEPGTAGRPSSVTDPFSVTVVGKRDRLIGPGVHHRRLVSGRRRSPMIVTSSKLDNCPSLAVRRST